MRRRPAVVEQERRCVSVRSRARRAVDNVSINADAQLRDSSLESGDFGVETRDPLGVEHALVSEPVLLVLDADDQPERAGLAVHQRNESRNQGRLHLAGGVDAHLHRLASGARAGA